MEPMKKKNKVGWIKKILSKVYVQIDIEALKRREAFTDVLFQNDLGEQGNHRYVEVIIDKDELQEVINGTRLVLRMYSKTLEEE